MMPQVRESTSPRSARTGSALVWIVGAAALALILWDTAARSARSLRLSAAYGVAVNAPAVDTGTATGYQLGRRSLLLPVLAPDAQHWVMQTQEMRARGDWRVREVDYDNAPDGREVHWGSPWRWYLLAGAAVDRTVTGCVAPLALERAPLWAGPALFAVLVALLVAWTRRRFGPGAAALVAIGMVGTAPLAVQFTAGNGDHHGLAVACVLGMVATLLHGATHATASARVDSAHRAFAFSGLCGALGMWVSAATTIPVLLGVGAGALATIWIGRRDAEDALEPELWRLWGCVGAGGCLLAYAIEYAPADFSWRLEVNHPLYALAWAAAGEFLCRLGRASRRMNAAKDLAWAAAAMCLVLLVPVLIAALGPRVFLPADDFLARLHATTIAEFNSLPGFLSKRGFDLAALSGLLPLLVVVASVTWLRLSALRPTESRVLILAAAPAATMLALAGAQIRWWGVAVALVMLVAAAVYALAEDRHDRSPWRRIWKIAAFALLLPGVVAAMRSATRASLPVERDVFRLAERDVAHRLRLRTGSDALVIAATPDMTTSLVYYSGGRGLGTLYWENHPGLQRAAALFGARSEADARAIMERSQVTHLVLFSWDETDAMLVRIHRRLPQDEPLPADTFASALRAGRLPPWLRPLPHSLPPHPLLRNHRVSIFEVCEPRSPERAAIDAATFCLEMGEREAARSWEAELEKYTESLAATATVAGLQLRRRDSDAFARSFARLTTQVSQFAALPLDDQVRVSLALAIGGRADQARTLLGSALEKTDEKAVRRLTPGTLSDLRAVSEELGVDFMDQGLRTLVTELIPAS